ncbi:MAG: hypothetical protein R6U98_28295, partial [Pirellulaceae bacterium]
MACVPAVQISAGIRRLEGRADAETPMFAPDSLFAGHLGLIRVDSLSRFWNNEALGFGPLESRQAKLLAGLCAGAIPWAYMVLGEPGRISVYLALPGGKDIIDAWSPTLLAAFPGSEISPGPSSERLIDGLAKLRFGSALTGNPSCPPPRRAPTAGKSAPQATLESVFRAMQGSSWAYLVFGRPVSQNEIHEVLAGLAREENELVSAHLRRGTAEENNNPQAKRYLDLLRSARKKYEAGTRQGMWNVRAVLLAAERARLALGNQTLLGAFAGPQSHPQPVRVTPCHPGVANAAAQLPSTCLTTAEAVAVARLPAEEFCGYRLRDFVQFAVDPPVTHQCQQISLGLVLDAGRRTANWFEIGRDDLCKHALVAGVPGSGKTATCQYLLRQLWEEHRIPWLVLEPSMKSEYRRLLAAPTGPDLRVFTLGDETGVPLRLNPLEVQPGVPVQLHIDGLMALFNAAFGLVTPMPYVLSHSLHRVYEERGWDLIGGTHPRGHGHPRQPTLSDLAATTERIVKELGYDREITGNLRAGLLTRLTSLTAGGKGKMLDCGASISMDDLLARPAVL